ncbi:MAG TPA: hypothetical protein VD794_14115 [Flavisolibacter sp.]|nr:hypothetical protein [Flavisolibacter sp.]
MSQSPFIDQLPEQRDLFASGVAYAFYKNLQEEKHQYSHIKVVLLAAAGGKQSYEYEVNELQTVKQKMGIAESIAKLIKAKKFQAIKPLLNDSSYFNYNKNELIENIIKADPMFGNALEFIPVGYHISRIDGHNNLHIAGEIKQDKQTNNFSVDIDMDDKLKRATLINYKY